jgi:calcineurin-like phosphoesterase family protein
MEDNQDNYFKFLQTHHNTEKILYGSPHPDLKNHQQEHITNYNNTKGQTDCLYNILSL